MSEEATIAVQLGLGGSYYDAVVDDGPYYYHRLNDLSGTIITDSMNHADGSYLGAPTRGVSGPLAEGAFALSLDGIDDGVTVVVPSTPTTFTFEAWVFNASWPAGLHPILSIGRYVVLYAFSGVLRAFVQTATDIEICVGSALATSTWIHVAVTYDGTTLRIYKNGVLDDDVPLTGALNSWAPDAYWIGKYYDSSVTFFYAGSLTEIAYYADVVLSASQLLAHYTAGAWTDVTVDVRDAVVPKIRYGIPGNSPRDRVASPGSCVFALDNGTGNSGGVKGYYSPDHASCRSGFDIGIPFRVGLTYAGTTYYKFRGVLSVIHPTPSTFAGPWLTHCVAHDYMDELQRTNLDTVPIQLSQTASALALKLIDNTTRKPASVAIATTTDTYPYVFDNSNDEGLHLLTEFQRLAQSEFGYCYTKGDTTAGGQFVFESRAQRAAKATNSSTLTDASYAQTEQAFQATRSRDDVINRVLVQVHPRRVDAAATTVLFKLTDTNTTIEIQAGETVSMVCPYTDPVQRDSRVGGTEMVTPASTTDYLFNAAADGLGTNLTSVLTVTAEFGANAGFLELTNGHTTVGYVTLLQLRGKGIYEMQRVLFSVDDDASQARFGSKTFVYETPYLSSSLIGKGIAQYLASVFAAEQTHVIGVTVPGGNSAAHMVIALAREVGDRISLTETQTGVTGSFAINSVALAIIHVGANQVDVQTTFTVTPFPQQSMWFLGTAGASELGVTTIIGF